jgi:REP element-mobilizing transposase RayT
MSLYRNQYRIESTRYPGWNYAWAGWYFITTCVKDRLCCLSTISGEDSILNQYGSIVAEEWKARAAKDIEIDEWVVMPNHFHAIVILKDGERESSLGEIVGQFKSHSSRRIHQSGLPEFEWQERFYDKIIRDPESLYEIRNYIRFNPLKWHLDSENPENAFL